MRTIKLGEGVVTSRLLIDLMRTAVALFLMEEYATSFSDELLICSAVFIGQAEGRLLSAAKIATYIGMPRATAIRKLQSLQKRGVVAMAAGKKYRITLDREEVGARVNRAIDACAQHIHRASVELSRLNS